MMKDEVLADRPGRSGNGVGASPLSQALTDKLSFIIKAWDKGTGSAPFPNGKIVDGYKHR